MIIVFHSAFKKKLRKLDPKIKKAFKERSQILKMNKFDSVLNNHSVEKKYPGCRSINITGDFRLVFKDLKDIVIFLKIGTHSELYG
jgi:addiction module RelE/StbE family toxin